MTSLASLGDLGKGRTVGTELCEGTPRVVPCTPRGLRDAMDELCEGTPRRVP